MMNVFIQEFPKQLKRSLEIGKQAKLSQHSHPIHNIVVLGMGGSGIGGDFVAEFVRNTCTVPFLACKSYELPAYVGKNTLVIASSFSGNTEETLTTFEKALGTGAKVVCISSGGQLLKKAEDLGLDFLAIPSVSQPPRTCLGYSMVQQLFVLKYFGFAPDSCIQDLENAIALLEEKQEYIKAEAAKIATAIHGKFPVIYATDRMGAVALRLRQQLNENSKLLALHHVFPEMNHNELVGWRNQNGEYAVLEFRSADDLHRNQIRMGICADIIKDVAVSFHEISCLGTSLIEQAMYGVHLGDWISWELAEARKMDAIEVNVIDMLKKELAAASLS